MESAVSGEGALPDVARAEASSVGDDDEPSVGPAKHHSRSGVPLSMTPEQLAKYPIVRPDVIFGSSDTITITKTEPLCCFPLAPILSFFVPVPTNENGTGDVNARWSRPSVPLAEVLGNFVAFATAANSHVQQLNPFIVFKSNRSLDSLEEKHLRPNERDGRFGIVVEAAIVPLRNTRKNRLKVSLITSRGIEHADANRCLVLDDGRFDREMTHRHQLAQDSAGFHACRGVPGKSGCFKKARHGDSNPKCRGGYERRLNPLKSSGERPLTSAEREHILHTRGLIVPRRNHGRRVPSNKTSFAIFPSNQALELTEAGKNNKGQLIYTGSYVTKSAFADNAYGAIHIAALERTRNRLAQLQVASDAHDTSVSMVRSVLLELKKRQLFPAPFVALLNLKLPDHYISHDMYRIILPQFLRISRQNLDTDTKPDDQVTPPSVVGNIGGDDDKANNSNSDSGSDTSQVEYAVQRGDGSQLCCLNACVDYEHRGVGADSRLLSTPRMNDRRLKLLLATHNPARLSVVEYAELVTKITQKSVAARLKHTARDSGLDVRDGGDDAAVSEDIDAVDSDDATSTSAVNSTHVSTLIWAFDASHPQHTTHCQLMLAPNTPTRKLACLTPWHAPPPMPTDLLHPTSFKRAQLVKSVKSGRPSSAHERKLAIAASWYRLKRAPVPGFTNFFQLVANGPSHWTAHAKPEPIAVVMSDDHDDDDEPTDGIVHGDEDTIHDSDDNENKLVKFARYTLTLFVAWPSLNTIEDDDADMSDTPVGNRDDRKDEVALIDSKDDDDDDDIDDANDDDDDDDDELPANADMNGDFAACRRRHAARVPAVCLGRNWV